MRHPTHAHSATTGQVLPELTLLSEWPTGHKTPTEYWLTSLPADTPLRRLVRLAKMRWRIEHDYREMKHGLGRDHFEVLRKPPHTESGPSSVPVKGVDGETPGRRIHTMASSLPAPSE